MTVSGCAATGSGPLGYGSGARAGKIYGLLKDERFPIPAVKISQVNPRYYRQEVDYKTEEKPRTIVVDTGEFFLYLVRENGRALRYGIGIGRAGYAWAGRAVIGRKAKWPTWTPPQEMIERDPKLVKYASGMPPGLDNPLGARALYLYQNGRDTLYRLHGTHEAYSIGRAVSSGCIRLLNQDVIDLYERVGPRTPVVVLPPPGGGAVKPMLHKHEA